MRLCRLLVGTIGGQWILLFANLHPGFQLNTFSRREFHEDRWRRELIMTTGKEMALELGLTHILTLTTTNLRDNRATLLNLFDRSE